MFLQFGDRSEGGRVLAEKLAAFKDNNDVIVLALPRGGVPVAFEVARALNAPLDVFVVRKLGVPGQAELAFGAIAAGGTTVFNGSLVAALRIPESVIERTIERERVELERREKLYRGGRPPLDLAGKTVIIADDGLATGATMRAAVAAVKAMKPRRVIVAAPVASHDTCEAIRSGSDTLCICAVNPEPFYGVGMWYRNFDQTTDDEVRRLLGLAQDRWREARSAG
jgi:predicted phosphoribosyltransferase